MEIAFALVVYYITAVIYKICARDIHIVGL